jgi:hypothetical protein
LTQKEKVLARISGRGAPSPVFLPDLTLWYEWHLSRKSLPEPWEKLSLSQIAGELGVPAWMSVKPWKIELPGIEENQSEDGTERTHRFRTKEGVLTSRWTLGPDNDWWQTEYPVKNVLDLKSAMELIQKRTYRIDTSRFAEFEKDAGESSILAVEIPQRPYSDLLHNFIGWSEGLLLLKTEKPTIDEMLDILEKKLELFIKEILEISSPILFLPDNLDSNFIYPPVFEEYCEKSYRNTAQMAHEKGKWVVVHVGGAIRSLLGLIGNTGVDVLEGIAGAPQSDASLDDARGSVGSRVTLWGGIPQDYLINTYDRKSFDEAVRTAGRIAARDPKVILGIADRVPVNADIYRIQAVGELAGIR